MREEATDSAKPTTEHKTVFSSMLKSNLPAAELSLDRLKHEALSITGGGVDTIKNALVTASYGIISNPAIYQRLHAELVEAISDPTGAPPTLPELEKLPYLSAIVHECKFPLSAPHLLQTQRTAPHRTANPLTHARKKPSASPTASPNASNASTPPTP